MIIERRKWQEFHQNGQLWIDGEIVIVAELWKHLYDFRTGFKGYENQPVVRLGIWTKYFDNGQIAWQLDFGNGTHENKDISLRKTFPSFHKDGTPVIYMC